MTTKDEANPRPWLREETVAHAMNCGHATVMFDDPSPDEDAGEVRIIYGNGVQIIYPARKKVRGW